MKILATGDIHADKNLAKKLADKAEKEQVDLIILNGDIVEEHKTEGILGYFAQKNKKLLILPGNHETIATTDFLAELYGATNLHSHAIKHKDIGIFGFGGANVGLTTFTEEDTFKNLKKAHNKIKDKKTRIMVTHSPPSNTLMEKFSNFVTGSEAVKKAVDELQPDILICGHIHEAEGIEEKIGKTKVINVGRKGKIIEI